MDNVILQMSGWDSQDRYYEAPMSIIRELAVRIKADGLEAAWNWFLTQVNFSDEPNLPCKYGVVDMRLAVWFLDWYNPDECLVEWEKEWS